MAGEQSTSYYTNINALLIDIVSTVTFSIERGEIVRQLNAYYSLLNIKELAGIERALLTTAFSVDRMLPATYANLLSLTGRSQAYVSTFNQFSTPRLQSELGEILASPLAQTLNAMRDIAIAQGSAGNFNVDH